MRANAQRKTAERKQNAPAPAISGLDFARHAARIADEMHASDVVILDLRGISSVADFFVIGTGTSERQMRAVADEVEKYGAGVGQKPYGVSGYDSPSWMLLDFVDVVIHLFAPAKRKYYDLELLWGDAPRIEWQATAKA